MAEYRIYDMAVIGSGPAGYSAALQAAKEGLSTFVFQGFEIGGQLMLYSEIEDYPGVEENISGADLADRFERQALDVGAEMAPENVSEVNFSDYPFRVWPEGESNPVEARTIIIATGAKHRWLGLKDEQRLMGRGVSGCVLCDAFFFAGKQVAVVGGGDMATHEALFLSRFASHVTIVHRSKEFRASKKMLDRVVENNKITIFENTVVQYVTQVAPYTPGNKYPPDLKSSLPSRSGGCVGRYHNHHLLPLRRLLESHPSPR